jgi:hypothetical protein
MRIVILCSSVYSETACAMAVRMSRSGHVPVGAIALPTVNRGTLLRKLGQWGTQNVIRYARAKLIPHRGDGHPQVHNPFLLPLLKHKDGVFRTLREVAKYYGFPVVVCSDQNSPDSIARLKEWLPDLIIFTGGNILRKPMLDLPHLGVLNVHLGLLPEVRGMSTPEWSLLNNVPVGITIHYVDAGIDTGPPKWWIVWIDVRSRLRPNPISRKIINSSSCMSGCRRGPPNVFPRAKAHPLRGRRMAEPVPKAMTNP